MYHINSRLVGGRVKIFLKLQKKTQKSLAQALHMKPNTLSNKLNGKAPLSVDEAGAIANYLTIPIQRLFDSTPAIAVEASDHMSDLLSSPPHLSLLHTDVVECCKRLLAQISPHTEEGRRILGYMLVCIATALAPPAEELA